MVMQSNDSSSVVAILDLPKGSILRLDGHAIVLRRDDFLGFRRLPLDGKFHLLTVRPANHSNTNSNNIDLDPLPCCFSSIATGFVLPINNCPVIRRFDPSTEEVSSTPPDNTTQENLLLCFNEQLVEPQRILSYNQVIPSDKSIQWEHLTGLISLHLLKRRNVEAGNKIVPGSFGEEELMAAGISSEHNKITDGSPVTYPSIPVLALEGKKYVSHSGTKQFVSQLTPQTRTSIFMSLSPGDTVLSLVLESQYNNRWQDLLGDIQLSYVIFLNIHCYASLEHWRDLVAMMSHVSADAVRNNSELYAGLLRVLTSQVVTMENEFFDDVELSGDNFFAPCMQRLIATLGTVKGIPVLSMGLGFFTRILNDRLPNLLSSEDENEDRDFSVDMTIDSYDESDGPVIVPAREIKESFVRSQKEEQAWNARGSPQTYDARLQQEYPLLFAARMPHEDIVMTCARALDDANDVSLVREAADYLENVEAKRMT